MNKRTIIVLGVVAAGLVAIGLRAGSQLITLDAKTAAPGAFSVSGVAAAAGSSLSFAKADHVHSLTGVLPLANGGTGVNSTQTVLSRGQTGGSAVQTLRVTSCTTAAAIGATCNTTVTWPSAFPDTSYTAWCGADTNGVATGFPVYGNYGTKAAGSIVSVTIAMTAAAAGGGQLNCFAIHD